MNKRIYWLIFSDKYKPGKLFLKKGFGHIDVLTKDDFNWLLFRPRSNRLEWQILNYNINDDVVELFAKLNFATILRVEVSMLKMKNGEFAHIKRPNLSFLHPINCVGIVKYLLGIWPYTFTPYGLYKWLWKKKYIIKELEISIYHRR